MLLFDGVVLIILSLMSCKELLQIVQDEDLQDLLPEISITDCQIFTAGNMMKFSKGFPLMKFSIFLTF